MRFRAVLATFYSTGKAPQEMMRKPEVIALPLIDVLLFVVAWILAYTLRFGLAIPDDPSLAAGNNYALQLKLLLPWVVITHVALYAVLNLYRGIWRYTGTTELRNLVIANVVMVVLWFLFSEISGSRESLFELPQRSIDGGSETEVLRIPRIILVVYILLATAATGAVRVLPRLVLEHTVRSANGDGAPPTLIVGAGDVADTLLRGLQRQRLHGIRPICAVAENRSHVGLRLHGIPVVGTLDKIAKVIEDNTIEQVLIALDDPTAERLRQVVDACGQAEVTFRQVPSLKDISEGRVEVAAVRRVEIEDLLGRETVKLDLPAERNYLRGETVLITGAGGSIGAEIARQAAGAGAGKLLLLGKGENSIFEITEEIQRCFSGLEAVPVVADIRDLSRLDRVFSEHRPGVVFHAAAHKHVPLMEAAPDEAVKNNVLGTANVASLSDAHGVKRFVLISTDKAVRPVSVMGATKRYGESIVFAMAARSDTAFVVVRFGNVLGSRGSVIPLFRRQIAAGGPVTVTDREVTRYFMTIPEAVALSIQAGSREEKGRLYLLDMGEPVGILDLARNMITLSGLRPDVDVKIDFIGLRPGEKLKEELVSEYEECRKTEVEKLLEAEVPPTRSWDEIAAELEEFTERAESGDGAGLVAMLRERVAEYEPPEHWAAAAPILATPEEPTELENAEEEPPEEVSRPEPQAVDMDLFGGEREEADKEPQAEESVSSEEEDEGLPLFESDAFREEAEPEPAELEEKFEPADEKDSENFHLGVESSPVQMDTVAPLGGKKSQDEREEAAMTNPKACCLLMRVTPGVEGETLKLLYTQLTDSILRPDDKVVFLAGADALDAVPEGADRVELAGPQGACIAQAMKKAPEAGVIITLSSEVLLRENALEVICDELARDNTPLVYTNFEENKGGGIEVVKPHDHEGCPHERFEYGPVIAYKRASIQEVGGIREDLSYAWEYDLHLKLMEKAPFRCIRQTLYTVFIPTQKDGKGSAVYSPGMGPLGGFSYVFYPEDMEKEVTSVFEEALKRRDAWIDHPTARVPHKEGHEVMVSVVTPILNRVKFIGNAIDKLIEQTYDNWELVVVDNGSTDGTVEKVQEYAAKDARIRLISGTGSSIASALNDGIRAARGKYIGQLDSDDQYDPKCIGMMVEKLESNPNCGLAISYYRLMDEDAKVIEDIAPVTHSGYSRNQILRRDGAGATRFFAKATLEEFGLYDEVHYGNFGEDYDMVVKTGEKYDVERVHEVLYYYRRHEDNTDVTRDPEMKYKNKNRARQEALKRRIAINKKLKG